jgi:hypothetical protein
MQSPWWVSPLAFMPTKSSPGSFAFRVVYQLVPFTTAFWLGLFSYKHLDDVEWWRFTLHDNASRSCELLSQLPPSRWRGDLSFAQHGAVSTHGCSPLSVDQAAARGGLAEMIGTTRSRVGLLFRPFRIKRGTAAYLNTPPMAEAKKIAKVAKSNPATIVFSEHNRIE